MDVRLTGDDPGDAPTVTTRSGVRATTKKGRSSAAARRGGAFQLRAGLPGLKRVSHRDRKVHIHDPGRSDSSRAMKRMFLEIKVRARERCAVPKTGGTAPSDHNGGSRAGFGLRRRIPAFQERKFHGMHFLVSRGRRLFIRRILCGVEQNGPQFLWLRGSTGRCQIPLIRAANPILDRPPSCTFHPPQES